MTIQKLILTVFITLILISCNDSKVVNTKNDTTVVQNIKKDNLAKKLDDNLNFIGDNLLSNKSSLLKHLINTYQLDTCGNIAYQEKTLREEFKGIKIVGDINGNKMPDTVFVLPPFNSCDDGYSYYFFDTTLPRLYTESFCCDPDNLFSIGDIDEDGISEI